ncbi:winged helix-turn-helix domain-containing protein [Streptomyces sp. NPDC093225]|uniref:winged helix-turn-helix domain-containing protein n=1 Tax=Streptomyces sp. NPDC093225 TaxID=3366034 RepID=UPI0038075E1A
MFAARRGSTDIAKELRVSIRSVQRWRHAWKAAGPSGFRSPGSRFLSGDGSHKSMTLSGISQMLRRRGWSHQVPARRAVERDEATVAGWVEEVWPHVETPRRRSRPGSPLRTKPASR